MCKTIRFIAAIIAAAALSDGIAARVQGQPLNLEEVLIKPLTHSTDLKIVKTDIAIGIHRRDEVRSLNFWENSMWNEKI